MDGTGFIDQGVKPAAQRGWAGRRARGRTLAGSAFALAVHVVLISVLALGMNRREPPAMYEEPAFTLVLAPQVQQPPPAPSQDTPRPKQITRPELRPFTPREVVRQTISPVAPLVTPPAAPPEPQAPPSPPSAAATPAPSAAASGQTTFQGLVLAKIERARRYPPAARARREEGVATVAFTMTRGGKVTSTSIVSGTGSSLLDREALETVRRAQPLPAVPDEIEAPLRLVVRLEFFVK